jgi:hypothetical protein
VYRKKVPGDVGHIINKLDYPIMNSVFNRYPQPRLRSSAAEISPHIKHALLLRFSPGGFTKTDHFNFGKPFQPFKQGLKRRSLFDIDETDGQSQANK